MNLSDYFQWPQCCLFMGRNNCLCFWPL